MTPWQRWVQRPQSLWVRKILFQIHLWAGIGIGLYVAAIGISGSAIVYRPGFRRTIVVADAGRPRMPVEEVEQSARRAYPAYEVLSVADPRKPGQADAVVLQAGERRVERLFDPYRARIWAIPGRAWPVLSAGSPICMTTCYRD